MSIPMSAKMRKEPLGCVLIIGPFNYPMICTIAPLLGAIAAGNTAVIKFSERIPAVSTVLRKIVEQALDPDCYAVVQGAIPETTALLAEKWNKIFFTGSETVGRVVAKAAAVNLTPTTLELGGRNPAVVTASADIRVAARRLLWGKVLNGGQACVSHNYVLVDQTVLPALIENLKKVYAEYFPEGTNSPDSPHITRLVPGGLPRIKTLLDDTSGEIILGGHMDASTSYLSPTVILAKDPSDKIITTETFGPVITLLPYSDLPSALSLIHSIDATPLALYPFSSSTREIDQIINSTTSGGVTVNDTILHGGIPSLEFGGIGESGMGSYRGKASFDCFTHRRLILNVPNWMEPLLSRRYPPYTSKKIESYKKSSEGKPDFDRDGNRKLGWVWWLVTAGTGKDGYAKGLIAGILAAVVATALVSVRKNKGGR